MRVGAGVATAVAVAALAGCATRAELGVEEGRPALSWKPAGVPAAQTRDAGGGAAEAEDRLRSAEARPEEDAELADALYALAVQRRRRGDTAEAESLYRRALETCERVQGPDHPDVAIVLTGLAALHAEQGDYAVAEPLLVRALAIRRAALGPEDTLSAQSMSNLALLYAAQGSAADAEPLYLEALAVLEKNDRSSADLAEVLENYAALLRDTGRDGEAQRLESRAGLLRATRGAGDLPAPKVP
jgi:tetratricopeptide (TPR) repeat protein